MRTPVVVLLALSLLRCSSASVKDGEERGACYPNGTCNVGLECRSNLCVQGPNASLDGGADGGVTGGGDGGTGTGDGGTAPGAFGSLTGLWDVEYTVMGAVGAGAVGVAEIGASIQVRVPLNAPKREGCTVKKSEGLLELSFSPSKEHLLTNWTEVTEYNECPTETKTSPGRLDRIRTGTGSFASLAGVWRYTRYGRSCDFTLEGASITFECTHFAGLLRGTGTVGDREIRVSAMPGLEVLRVIRR